MSKIKFENTGYLFFEILEMYSRICFEKFYDCTGGEYFILRDRVICIKRIHFSIFNVYLKAAFVIRGIIDINLQTNYIQFIEIKDYKYLDEMGLFDLLIQIKEYTNIDFFGDPIK